MVMLHSQLRRYRTRHASTGPYLYATSWSQLGLFTFTILTVLKDLTDYRICTTYLKVVKKRVCVFESGLQELASEDSVRLAG